MTNNIENNFPNLKFEGYSIESPTTIEYNCIAWAAGENNRWWWPDSYYTSYWPEDVPRKIKIETFILAFEKIGYKKCKNSEYEPGFEKICIYTDNEGKPSHAARQLSGGLWTSKLGISVDITHMFSGLDNSIYGNVSVIMKRKVSKK